MAASECILGWFRRCGVSCPYACVKFGWPRGVIQAIVRLRTECVTKNYLDDSNHHFATYSCAGRRL